MNEHTLSHTIMEAQLQLATTTLPVEVRLTVERCMEAAQKELDKLRSR